MIFGAPVSHKEAVICVLVQVVDAFNHEVVIVSSAFNNLGIKDVGNESQKVIIVAASR